MSRTIENIKNEVDDQLHKAIYSNSNSIQFHPIRIIQALKSLIGIDIENPSVKLVDWGKSYLEKQDVLPEDYFRYSIQKPKETIVISNLSKQISDQNRSKATLELQDLCSVSDGNQIFEYMIEFSLKHDTYFIPFLWSSYRSNIFLKNKYTYPLLKSSIDMILDNNNCSNELSGLSSIEYKCIIESIKNAPLVRHGKIISHLDDFRIDDNVFYNKLTSNRIDVIRYGRIAILNYLNSLNIDCISKEMILLLDSFRMAFKDLSDDNNKKNLNNMMNYIIKNELYNVEKNW